METSILRIVVGVWRDSARAVIASCRECAKLVYLDPWVDVAHRAIVYGADCVFVEAFQFTCQGAMAKLVWQELAHYGGFFESVEPECHADCLIFEVGDFYCVIVLGC